MTVQLCAGLLGLHRWLRIAWLRMFRNNVLIAGCSGWIDFGEVASLPSHRLFCVRLILSCQNCRARARCLGILALRASLPLKQLRQHLILTAAH